MSVFKVRYLTPKCFEIQQAILNAFSGSGSGRGRAQVSKVEVEGSLAVDQNGILVGELDGKPISFTSFLRYNNTYCHGGIFYVEPKYRGCGYGEKLFWTGIKRVLPSHVISMNVQEHMLGFIESRVPTRSHCKMHITDLNLQVAYQRLSTLSSSSLYFALPVNAVDKQSLVQYDASVFGYPRETFLEKWLAVIDGYATVAVTNQGEIVGYVASRVPYVQEVTNYLIGPLYANSVETATVLLRSLFEDMLTKEEQNLASLSKPAAAQIRYPVGMINSEAAELFEFLGGKVVYESNFISISSTGAVPKGRFNNWYGITSALVG